jgi:hypothetical protein
MQRRAFLELLAATPLAATPRGAVDVDPPTPPAYKVVRALPFPGRVIRPARRARLTRLARTTRPSCAR